MYREAGTRLRSAMADDGVDCWFCWQHGDVSVLRHRRRWPLLDAGLSHVERPVAIVLATDESIRICSCRSGRCLGGVAGARRPCARAAVSRIRRGRSVFRAVLADLIRPGATIAVDELTGAMARSGDRLFPAGPPSDAAPVVGAAKLVKTIDQIACIRRACRITEEAVVEVQKAVAPGVRQIDLSAAFVRRAFELGATTNMLEAIWQVMPDTKAEGVWTTHGDLALPLLTTERALSKGDVLWTDVSITYAGYCSDFGRTWIVGAGADAAPTGPVPPVAAHPRRRAGCDEGRCHVR